MTLGVQAAIAARADDRAGAARLALESADILRERGFDLALAHSLIVHCEATGDASNGEEIKALLAEAADSLVPALFAGVSTPQLPISETVQGGKNLLFSARVVRGSVDRSRTATRFAGRKAPPMGSAGPRCVLGHQPFG
ncbi:hypothetical protein [Micromonospora foliorum]|uniref:hypothetical protein n=1 Tax=Micromonospora foliorum TaxID=2911210 RepID=UPI001EE94BFA|nr:hypothetical protein [Micromonospora foliorum]MCG5435414.1 hypothetical protein [Micromonospora foliorum]